MCPAQRNPSTEDSSKHIAFKFWVVALILTIVVTFIAMGLFTKLFRGQPTQVNTEISFTPGHQEDWAAYMSTIDNDKAGSILVDLGLKAIAPIMSKDRRLRINVAINEPSLNGLPGADEHELLGRLSEQLAHELKSSAGAVFAGHLFCQGTLSLYFYLGETSSFQETVTRVFDNYRNHRYEVQLDKEHNWQTYMELLYPLPIQMQSIHNQKVVDHLRKSGDKLEKKRPVDHMIYFKSETDIDRFLNEIKGKGFQVVGKQQTELEGYSWSVLLRRNDPVDPQRVDEYVLYLWQKAHDANGEYDGWGSTIVRE